jgi:hypothetical protein
MNIEKASTKQRALKDKNKTLSIKHKAKIDKITRTWKNRKHKGKCILAQSNRYKLAWDLLIVILLLSVCIVIPWRIAFVKEESSLFINAFLIIDGIFLIDMILTFFTTYSDKRQEEVTGHKAIAIEYFRLWFWIDLVSIFPFDTLSQAIIVYHGGDPSPNNAAYMVKAIRLSKIGKLIRLMRLFKLIKIMKNSKDL